ncbi:MAG: LPS-assembly protein LptD [Alphaproteobacteria bacterium]
MNKKRLSYTVSTFVLVNIMSSTSILADDDIVITGKKAVYNNKTKISTITKDVKAVQGKNTITADEAQYFKDSGNITATGNVVVIDEKGKKTTASKAISKKKEKVIIAYDALQNQEDDTYIEAKKIYIYNEKDDIANDVNYSSCKINEKDKSRVWLLNIRKARMDEEKEIIKMNDVVMKIADTPVFYWPYMEVPSPSVKKLDGWLLPTVGNNTNIGTFVSNSYYKSLGDDKDIIFKPTYTTKNIFTAGASYRKKKEKSYTEADISISNDKISNKNSGHLFVKHNTISKTNWLYKTQVELTTNKEYLKKHVYLKHQDKDYLKNNLEAQKNTKNSSLKVSASHYKDIRKNPTPNIHLKPSISYETQFEKDGVTINSYTRAKSLTVKNVSKVNNATSTLSVSKTSVTKEGFVFTPSLSLRGDVSSYKYNETLTVGGKSYNKGNESMVTPYASFIASYPMTVYNKKTSFIVEPIAGIFISKKQANKAYFPNNDSDDFELDEANLFAQNRYAGYDKIDTGKRIAYGLKLKQWKNTRYVEAFIGQSINKDNGSIYSDYIGNLHVNQGNYSLTSTFELDSKNYSIRKLEASGTAKINKWDINATYTHINPRQTSKLKKTKQLNSEVIYTLNKNWQMGADITFNFANAEKKLSKRSLIASYTTDCGCMKTTLKYTKDYTKNIHKPETTMFLSVEFVGLTTLKTSDALRKIN